MASRSSPGVMSFSQSEGGGGVPPPPLGVKVNVAGVVSMLPAASLAHTLNVYVVPTVRLSYIWGEVQLVRVESRPTNLHWNELGSLEVNSKVAVVPITLPLRGLVMVVSGGVVTVQLLLLGVRVNVAGVL